MQNKLTLKEAQVIEERLLAEEKQKKVLEEKRFLIEAVAAAAVGQKEKDLEKMVCYEFSVKLSLQKFNFLCFYLFFNDNVACKGKGRQRKGYSSSDKNSWEGTHYSQSI